MNTPTDITRADAVRPELTDSGDSAWVLAQREHSLALSGTLEWPARRKTPLARRHLDQIDFMAPAGPAEIPPALSGTLVSPAHMSFANGALKSVQVAPSLASAGLVLMSLHQASTDYASEVEAHLGHVAAEPATKAEALNLSLWDEGTFIKIPDNVSLDAPILLLHYTDGDTTHRAMPRTLILAGANSRVTVIERYVSSGSREKVLFSSVVEIAAEQGAHVHYGSLQNLSDTTEAFLQRYATVQHDAEVNWSIGEFGAALTVTTDQTLLQQPGAGSTCTMVFFGSGSQRQDFDMRIVHAAPHTNSNIVANGVMNNKARSAFIGVTDIKLGSVQADGRQKEKTLMLSDESRADAIPSLWINENDVYASHAASTGPIDKIALFYLMARGLTQKQATRLFVQGFLAPVVDAIPLDNLRDSVWASVERKLAE